MLYKTIFGLTVLALLLSQAVYAAGPAAVNLGSAGSFAILSKAGISTTGTTSITGDIGVSPIDSTAITGFGLALDLSGQFSTSNIVNGKIYAADYNAPTPTTMTTAVSDMQAAYTDAAGRTDPTATELGSGNIGGMTLAPGLYKWSTGVTIPTSVTLSGGPNDVWIFQIAQNLDVGNGVSIILSGGAQPQNVFWQVAGQATLGTTSGFEGIILSQTAVIVNTGATVDGRLMAQTAVTLDADAVTAPTGVATTTASTTTISGGSTAPTTTIGGGSTASTTIGGGTTAPTTTISGATTAPTTTVIVSTLSTSILPTIPVTTSIWESTISGSGSPLGASANESALIVAAVVVVAAAAGVYYYLRVMKK